MRPTREELEAHARKSSMLRRLPLEQAKTYINGPLYGLTEEVVGLVRTEHRWQCENCMRFDYLSSRYSEYSFDNDPTFMVITRLFGEDEKLPGPPGDLHPPPRFQAGQQFTIMHLPDGRTVGGRLPGQDRCHRLIAKDATFTVDGKSFKGGIIHYTAPVRYSSFMLYHRRIELKGEALGPSIEELIQIVESLHDLNGKEVQ
jgi:hypothetical protein